MALEPSDGMGTAVRVAGAKPAFLIFEGGGAKGIAHLGALQAIENLGYTPAGVAGASAGAFVAALVAAGYRSTELLDPDSPSKNLLSTTFRDGDPIGLLGIEKWDELKHLRRRWKCMAAGAKTGGKLGAVLAAPHAARIILRAAVARGHFSTDGVRDFVNDRIRERLRDIVAKRGDDPETVPKIVCFRNLDDSRFDELRPLKIIATDVDSMKPVLFDRLREPGVPVGDAVAASIAIPGVFQPVQVRIVHGNERKPDRNQPEKKFRSGLFMDGGLVSNLPFWVFGEEKLALERTLPGNPAVPVIAFSLVDHPDVVARPSAATNDGAFDFVARVTRTAIFGSQSLARSLLRDLTDVPIQTKLGVLDFDANWETIRGDYVLGRQCATHVIRKRLELEPAFFQGQLGSIVAGVQRLITAKPDSALPTSARFRAYFIKPLGTHSLRVSHAWNMDRDPDDQFVFDVNCERGAPKAFRLRDIEITPFGPADVRDHMTKYERAQVWSGLRTALCVPVFDNISAWTKDPDSRPKPLGVLVVDCDQDLEMQIADDEILLYVVNESVRLSVAIQ